MGDRDDIQQIKLDEQDSLIDDDLSLLEDRPPELAWKTRILYAIGPLGIDIGNLLVGFFFTPFLLEVAQLDPYFAGFVFLLGQIIDAVTTPVVGKLSDNTRSRWGRRRPYLMFGSIPYLFIYICLWNTWPSPLGQGFMFAYYLIVYSLYSFLGIFENNRDVVIRRGKK